MDDPTATVPLERQGEPDPGPVLEQAFPADAPVVLRMVACSCRCGTCRKAWVWEPGTGVQVMLGCVGHTDLSAALASAAAGRRPT